MPQQSEVEFRMEHVAAAVRSHMHVPAVAGTFAPRSRAHIEETSRCVLDVMLTRQFRVGPLPAPDVYAQLLRRVRFRVARGEPVHVSMGYGAQKNPHGAARPDADWAEFFSLCHLVAWHNKVQAAYPPGLRIRPVVDDVTLLWANDGDLQKLTAYSRSLERLIGALHFERVLRPPFRLSWLLPVCRLFYPIARWRVARWERSPANREQLERMHEAARRNLALPDGRAPHEADRQVAQAAHRYRIFWEALRLSHLSQSTRRIVAMYLDGSQHHIRQPVTLHLTTLDKGQVTQPWQGEGALRDNGHGRLEPWVLTAGRKSQCTVATFDGLDIIPLGGFSQIRVVAFDGAQPGGRPVRAATKSVSPLASRPS